MATYDPFSGQGSRIEERHTVNPSKNPSTKPSVNTSTDFDKRLTNILPQCTGAIQDRGRRASPNVLAA